MPTLFEANTKSVTEAPSAQKSFLREPLRLFSSFALRPKGVRFETQEPEEEVILFLRQHLIVLIPWLVLGVVLMALPPIAVPLLISLYGKPIPIPVGYGVIATLFWYIAVFGFMVSKLMRWHFNIFLITTERIVDIDFINLLYKEISEAKITRVQDISYQTKGVLATFLDYGNVTIQTAGELPNFIFESVPKPDDVVDIISDIVKKTSTQNI